jgi:hypothetical protein
VAEDLCLIDANLLHLIISRKDGFCAISEAAQTAEVCKAQRCGKKLSAERLSKKNIQTEILIEEVAPVPVKAEPLKALR